MIRIEAELIQVRVRHGGGNRLIVDPAHVQQIKDVKRLRVRHILRGHDAVEKVHKLRVEFPRRLQGRAILLALGVRFRSGREGRALIIAFDPNGVGLLFGFTVDPDELISVQRPGHLRSVC